MAWNKAKPSGTDAIKDSDDSIRANWVALDTVLVNLIAGAAAITATAAEINSAIDGITATAAEINTGCDGITAEAAELNKLDGASANVTATNLNTLTAGAASDAGSLHKHTRVDYGNYTGDNTTRDIAVAFSPNVVILVDATFKAMFIKFPSMSTSYALGIYGGSNNFTYGESYITLGTNKFTVYGSAYITNTDTHPYHWIAIKATD